MVVDAYMLPEDHRLPPSLLDHLPLHLRGEVEELHQLAPCSHRGSVKVEAEDFSPVLCLRDTASLPVVKTCFFFFLGVDLLEANDWHPLLDIFDHMLLSLCSSAVLLHFPVLPLHVSLLT